MVVHKFQQTKRTSHMRKMYDRMLRTINANTLPTLRLLVNNRETSHGYHTLLIPVLDTLPSPSHHRSPPNPLVCIGAEQLVEGAGLEARVEGGTGVGVEVGVGVEAELADVQLLIQTKKNT